jgi:hypothetical protein
VARERVRVVILCEDAVHRAFFEGLCKQLGKSPIRVLVAPKGLGSGEQWVRENYVREVRAHRSQANHQPNLALLVATDGDRFGVVKRKESLDQALLDAGLRARGPLENLAICVPTWSIETWLAWLCQCSHLGTMDEQTRYKNDADYGRCEQQGQITTRKAVEAWTVPPLPTETTVVPSLTDGRAEWLRIP